MLTPTPLYREIACLLRAIENCERAGNSWQYKHAEKLESLCKNFLPSGGGIDAGTKIDLEKSTPAKLVFSAPYHHMNESGFYNGWTEHRITVTPSLEFGFDLHISGRNRNDIKEYLHEVFNHSLSVLVVQGDESKGYEYEYAGRV